MGYLELGKEFMLVSRKCRVGGTENARLYCQIEASMCFVKAYVKDNIPVCANKLLKSTRLTELVKTISEYTNLISLSDNDVKKIENLYNDRSRVATQHERDLVDRLMEDTCKLVGEN